MSRITTAFFALFALLAFTGCDGFGLPDATDEVERARRLAAESEQDGFDTQTSSDAQDTANASEESDEAPVEDESDEDTSADEPADDYSSECIFGATVADMAGAEDLELDDFDHVVGTSDMTNLEKEQLLEGFLVYGDGDVDGITDLLERWVDDERVMVRTVIDLEGETAYTHLAFWTEGHEQGYVFLQDSLRLVAAVDGGYIIDCQVTR